MRADPIVPLLRLRCLRSALTCVGLLINSLGGLRLESHTTGYWRLKRTINEAIHGKLAATTLLATATNIVLRGGQCNRWRFVEKVRRFEAAGALLAGETSRHGRVWLLMEQFELVLEELLLVPPAVLHQLIW